MKVQKLFMGPRTLVLNPTQKFVSKVLTKASSMASDAFVKADLVSKPVPKTEFNPFKFWE